MPRILKSILRFTLFLLISFLIQWVFKLEWYFGYSLILFCYFIQQFVVNLGKRIVFIEFLTALAFLQWLVGPVAYYLYLGDSLFFAFKMMLSQQEYFAFVLPSTLMLITGLYIPLRHISEDHRPIFENIKVFLSTNPKLGLILVAIGVISSFLANKVPGSIGFAFFLLKDFMYIGTIYLFFSPFRSKVIILSGVFALILYSTISQGMFKEFVFWVVFFVIFLTFRYKVSLRAKVLFSLGIGLMIGIIQSVKGEYRLATWNGKQINQSKTSIFVGLIKANINNPNSVFLSEQFLEQNVHRLNQGALISHIVDHTPRKQEFARGETVKSAVFGSIFPRFIFKNKRVADSKLFEKYSGIKLSRGTSMGMSPLGEAYANFGKIGAMIFMLFYGLLIGAVFAKFLTYSSIAPTVVLWLPMVFYQVLAVESDLFKVLNSLTKGALMVILVFYVFRQILKIKI